MSSKKTKFLGVFILLVSLILTMAACDMGEREEDSTPETYGITLNVIGEGEILEPEEGDYPEGKTEIAASADDGWVFYRWEGDVQEEYEEETSIYLDEDKEIVAIFIEDYEGDYNNDGFAGWEGTEDKPYLIKNPAQLNNVRDELESHFVLINDVDLTDFNDWDPIGDFEERDPFLGFFDGRGYEISNLCINLEEVIRVGLFSYIDGEAVVKNLNIIDADVTGRSHTGILAGGNGFDDTDSQIINVYTSGSVEASFAVGGVVGTNYALVEDSSFDGTVVGVGLEFENTGMIAATGGLVGQNRGGKIINSYTSGIVDGEGIYVGGLVGLNIQINEIGGNISNCFSDAEVIGEFNVGGLVGHTHLGSEIKNSHASGSVTGKELIGGLVGVNEQGLIYNSYALGDVSGTETIGGLVGFNDSGDNYGLVELSYSKSLVEGEHSVGGLIGFSKGKALKSFATGELIGKNEGHFGGLLGDNEGTIEQCFAAVDIEIVNAGEGSVAGGLVGWNPKEGEIKNSYSTGKINSTGDGPGTGGLVGVNDSNILYSYATGEVVAENRVGGLVGSNRNEAEVKYSYYDKDTTKQDDDEGKGLPKSTANMIQQMTFEPEWDFDDIWSIDEGSSYPYFQWQTDNIPYPPS